MRAARTPSAPTQHFYGRPIAVAAAVPRFSSFIIAREYYTSDNFHSAATFFACALLFRCDMHFMNHFTDDVEDILCGTRNVTQKGRNIPCLLVGNIKHRCGRRTFVVVGHDASYRHLIIKLLPYHIGMEVFASLCAS